MKRHMDALRQQLLNWARINNIPADEWITNVDSVNLDLIQFLAGNDLQVEDYRFVRPVAGIHSVLKNSVHLIKNHVPSGPVDGEHLRRLQVTFQNQLVQLEELIQQSGQS